MRRFKQQNLAILERSHSYGEYPMGTATCIMQDKFRGTELGLVHHLFMRSAGELDWNYGIT